MASSLVVQECGYGALTTMMTVMELTDGKKRNFDYER
jgi:hypothetical protein